MKTVMENVLIGERRVGAGEPVFIIAEAGVNHNGDTALARRLIDAAADAGADAVKFQTFKAERLVSPSAPKAEYQLQTTDPAESQFEMIRRLELSAEAHRELQDYCRRRGILFMSTPFDEESAGLLNELGVPAFKVGSGEVTNWPFLAHLARFGKPVILSTGMSYLGEVEEALGVIRREGPAGVVLLHCVSNYPAAPADANLKAIGTMAAAFRVPVGYSDHTPGSEVSVAAVALGACVIEKHLTLDRQMPGPDHLASIEPHELGALVAAVRNVEAALGDGVKAPKASESGVKAVARRSLAAAADLREGDRLERSSLRPLRPGTGLSPSLLEVVCGRRLRRDVKAGELISWGDLA